MTSNRINVGIVGLGRWAKVLARAVAPSDLIRITSGYSRSEEKRSSFAAEFGVASTPDLATMLWGFNIGLGFTLFGLLGRIVATVIVLSSSSTGRASTPTQRMSPSVRRMRNFDR